MNISEFAYFNQLKNQLANISEELEERKQHYLSWVTDLDQLKNDYDVNTIDELASVLNNGDDDQKTDDIKNALLNNDENYLLSNMKMLNNTDFQKCQSLKEQVQELNYELTEVERFYKNGAIPIIDKMKKSKMVEVTEISSSKNSSDTILHFNFLSDFTHFQEFFSKELYVDEIIKDHLRKQEVISMMISEDNYPNEYDMTRIEDTEEDN